MHLWRRDGFLRHKSYVRSKLLVSIRTQRRDARFWADLPSNAMRAHLVQTYHEIPIVRYFQFSFLMQPVQSTTTCDFPFNDNTRIYASAKP
jgi:hypothetical protein